MPNKISNKINSCLLTVYFFKSGSCISFPISSSSSSVVHWITSILWPKWRSSPIWPTNVRRRLKYFKINFSQSLKLVSYPIFNLPTDLVISSSFAFALTLLFLIVGLARYLEVNQCQLKLSLEFMSCKSLFMPNSQGPSLFGNMSINFLWGDLRMRFYEAILLSLEICST